MPEPFSLSVCALKTASAMFSILAAGDKDVSFESVALAVEGLVKGGEAVKAFRERDQKIFAATLNATAKKLEALYQDSLRQSHSAGFRESVQVAFANLSEVIARCLPTGEALARMNHDPEKIAAAVVDAALKKRMEVFADPNGEARKILVLLVSETYSALRGDAKFMAALQGVNWAEVLSRLSRIEGKIDRIESEAERRHREIMDTLRLALPAKAEERGVPEAPLRRVLERLGDSQIPASENPSRIRKRSGRIATPSHRLGETAKRSTGVRSNSKARGGPH